MNLLHGRSFPFIPRLIHQCISVQQYSVHLPVLSLLHSSSLSPTLPFSSVILTCLVLLRKEFVSNPFSSLSFSLPHTRSLSPHSNWHCSRGGGVPASPGTLPISPPNTPFYSQSLRRWIRNGVREGRFPEGGWRRRRKGSTSWVDRVGGGR